MHSHPKCASGHMPAPCSELKTNAADEERMLVMVGASVDTLHRIWPKAAVGLALALNCVWIAALGYGVYWLLLS
jgi:hypothetical protein